MNKLKFRTKKKRVPAYQEGGAMGYDWMQDIEMGYGNPAFTLGNSAVKSAGSAIETAPTDGNKFNPAGLISAASSMIPNTPKPQNQSFEAFKAEAGYNNSTAGAENTANAIQKGVGAIPVWGQIVAGGMEIGKQIGKATKDEYGIYKSKFGEVADNIFNPVKHISNFKNIENPKDLVNSLTMGLIGKSSEQKKLEELKKLMNMKKATDGFIKNEQAGAMFQAGLPDFTAPAYGRRGMKFRTKLTKSY